MAKGFNVTFERITAESAENGEAESIGFVAEDCDLRDAIRYVCGFPDPSWLPHCEADSWPVTAPRWFTFYKTNDGTREYFEKGVEENRAIHLPETATPATRRRIARLFGCAI